MTTSASDLISEVSNRVQFVRRNHKKASDVKVRGFFMFIASNILSDPTRLTTAGIYLYVKAIHTNNHSFTYQGLEKSLGISRQTIKHHLLLAQQYGWLKIIDCGSHKLLSFVSTRKLAQGSKKRSYAFKCLETGKEIYARQKRKIYTYIPTGSYQECREYIKNFYIASLIHRKENANKSKNNKGNATPELSIALLENKYNLKRGSGSYKKKQIQKSNFVFNRRTQSMQGTKEEYAQLINLGAIPAYAKHSSYSNLITWDLTSSVFFKKVEKLVIERVDTLEGTKDLCYLEVQEKKETSISHIEVPFTFEKQEGFFSKSKAQKIFKLTKKQVDMVFTPELQTIQRVGDSEFPVKFFLCSYETLKKNVLALNQERKGWGSEGRTTQATPFCY